MKIELVNDDYILIEPCTIITKQQSSIVYDPMAGLTSTVITYKVIDSNKYDKLKNKIIGVHKANVYPFETKEKKYFVVDKKAVVFIAEPEEHEKAISEEERRQLLNPANAKKDILDIPDKKLIIP